MPTIFRKLGFRFFFFSADWNEPIHVHVERGESTAKFWINPISIASSYKMTSKDLKTARILIEQNIDLIKETWDEYFKFIKIRN